jgi:AcrR family transcriptional regulator
MATARRVGSETSATRLRLLDVVEQIMLEDGYAAVSSRRLAKGAGITPAAVHYYFSTLDDLFVAALRRRADEQRERMKRLLSSPQPLWALWRFSRDQAATGLLLEFMALANHRKAIRATLAGYADEFRTLELETLGPHLEAMGLDTDELPAEVLLVLNAALSRTLVLEESLGMRVGLKATNAAIERFLARVEGPAPRRRAR